MKKIILNCSLLFLILFGSIAQNATSSKRKAHFNLNGQLALQGYDPVAYFKQNKAVKGKKEFDVSADGIIYYCSSEANRALLLKNYAAYEPQYGGWCAYAMGSGGKKVEIDPETFKITDGKLYLFYNAYFNNTLKDWNKNENNLKKQADAIWLKFIQ